MLITFRRTGGLLSLLAVSAVALAATVLTLAVAATLLIVGIAIGAGVLLGRAVLPRSWLDRRSPSATPWPQETIDATVVTRTKSGRREPPRLHGDAR